jgi:hypothetical protein
MSPLEARLAGAFQEAHTVAGSQLGFGMATLLGMVADSGPTEAARRIVRQPSKVFTKLSEHRRLDLSVEAIVLRAEFRPLFTDDELRLASERLRAANFELPELDGDAREMEDWARLARKAQEQWDRENPW